LAAFGLLAPRAAGAAVRRVRVRTLGFRAGRRAWRLALARDFIVFLAGFRATFRVAFRAAALGRREAFTRFRPVFRAAARLLRAGLLVFRRAFLVRAISMLRSAASRATFG